MAAGERRPEATGSRLIEGELIRAAVQRPPSTEQVGARPVGDTRGAVKDRSPRSWERAARYPFCSCNGIGPA